MLITSNCCCSDNAFDIIYYVKNWAGQNFNMWSMYVQSLNTFEAKRLSVFQMLIIVMFNFNSVLSSQEIQQWWKGIYSLLYHRIFHRIKLKAFACNNSNTGKNNNFCLFWGCKHCEKRRKCWSPAFSPFPTMFSKAFSFRVVKCEDCVVEFRHI